MDESTRFRLLLAEISATTVSMRLSEYLLERNESVVAFGKRAGIPRSTVSDACAGYGVHNDTALKIVRATGGLVSSFELESEKSRSQQATG